MTAMAMRQRVSCDGDEGERQKWAWERGRDERESELRFGLSCDGDEDLGWGKDESDWESEEEAESDSESQISESEVMVSFKGWGLNLFNMLQTTLYRGKKKVEWRRLRLETRQPLEPCEPVTIHRIGWSDRSPNGSMLFSHGTVLHLKWTVDVNGSRVSWSNSTVRFGFKFHDL